MKYYSDQVVQLFLFSCSVSVVLVQLFLFSCSVLSKLRWWFLKYSNQINRRLNLLLRDQYTVLEVSQICKYFTIEFLHFYISYVSSVSPMTGANETLKRPSGSSMWALNENLQIRTKIMGIKKSVILCEFGHIGTYWNILGNIGTYCDVPVRSVNLLEDSENVFFVLDIEGEEPDQTGNMTNQN